MIKFEITGRNIIFRIFANAFGEGGLRISMRNHFNWLMNKIYLIDSKGNKKRVFKIKNLKIVFEGRGNEVYIHEPAVFRGNCKFLCSNNCKITIKGTKYRIKDLNLVMGSEGSFYVGNNFSCGGAEVSMFSNKNMSVSIGDDCLFSTGIYLRTSDGHKIYADKDDAKTALNTDKNITISDHVWVGQNVMLLKGSVIGRNSVVGANSLVNKEFNEENIIIAGMPAKKVKGNINWDHSF